MSLTLLVDTVQPTMIAISIESTSDEDKEERLVELALVVVETDSGFKFNLTGAYGKEIHTLLEGIAPMEIYKRGWKKTWSGF